MTCSMTAFARREANGDWGSAVWEIRSVNHRYLELNIHLPEIFSELEVSIRDRLRHPVQRGKIDCLLRYQPNDSHQAIQVNQAVVKQLCVAAQAVQSLVEVEAQKTGVLVNALEVLRWPGVIQPPEIAYQDIQNTLLLLFDNTLEDLIAARAREGLALATTIASRLVAMEQELAKIKTRLPQILPLQRDKLLARFQEAQISLDNQRLEQEMVLFANRIDISEELDRLETHLTEVRRILLQAGAVGRRLDFLLQELNREANTVASKSIDAETTRSAVELKVLIEQVREQVQNFE